MHSPLETAISKIAEQLNVAWNTANTAILDEGKRHLIDDPTRFDGVRVLGVDEHVWRHTRRGDKYVTVIIDLIPVHESTGWPASTYPGIKRSHRGHQRQT